MSLRCATSSSFIRRIRHYQTRCACVFSWYVVVIKTLVHTARNRFSMPLRRHTVSIASSYLSSSPAPHSPLPLRSLHSRRDSQEHLDLTLPPLRHRQYLLLMVFSALVLYLHILQRRLCLQLQDLPHLQTMKPRSHLSRLIIPEIP